MKNNKINSQQLPWISVSKNNFLFKKDVAFILKDFLPAHQRSNIVYKYWYLSHYDKVHIGRMSQRLEERIRLHVPKFIRNKIKPQKDLPRRQCKPTQNALVSDSAVDQHLLDNKIIAENFDTNWFFILATGRSSFHLAKLKASFIEYLQPSLCCRKKFVHRLKLSRLLRK